MTAPLPVAAYDGGALRFEHLELWVGNAKQAAEYYITALGFRPLAYAGPETGLTDRASYVVAQGAIRLVLTSALRPRGPINDHVAVARDVSTEYTALRSKVMRNATGTIKLPINERARRRDR